MCGDHFSTSGVVDKGVMALWGIQVHGFYTSGFGVGFGTWSARDAIAVPAFPPFAYLDWGGLVGSLFACLLTDARHGSSFAEFSKKRILLTRTLSSVFEERRCRLRTMGHGGASSCLIVPDRAADPRDGERRGPRLCALS